MLRLVFSCLFLAYAMPSCVEVSAARPDIESAIPMLTVKPDNGSPGNLQISQLHIDIQLTGNIATTTFDISFYNPSDKILEGEFDFPLADGQNISRYALDINGALREGVVVEKAKARAAFENTIRKGIDPGLVEKTKGNNFRTRIYPIPAKGYKRVVIGIEQTLGSVKEGLVYKLPLLAEKPMDQFSISAKVVKAAAEPLIQNNRFKGFGFVEKEGDWSAKFEAENYTVADQVELIVPEEDSQSFTEKYDGKTYFYAHTTIEGAYQDKPNPSAITLLWDMSASAATRNRQKETDLLVKYFDRIENVSVSLVPFNIKALPTESFVIRGGDSKALVQRLQSYPLDGGTQLGAIDLHQYTGDEIIMFTDGLSTFGKRDIILSSTPVTVVSSSAGADYSCLKFIAGETRGRFINLAESDAGTALDEMVKQPFQCINAVYNPDDISELVTQTDTRLQGGFSFAGILKKGQASVTLHFGYGNKITQSKTILISDDQVTTAGVKRIWASTKIAILDLEYEKNKSEITALGKAFSIVTQNTSLLVLDRVEDYLQYEITPPVELQKEYDVLLKEQHRIKTNEKAEAIEEALNAMNGIKEWYYQKSEFHNQAKPAPADFETYSIRTVNQSGIADNGIVSPPNDSTKATVPADKNIPFEERPAEQNKAKESESEVPLQAVKTMAAPPQVEMAKFTPPVIVKDEAVKAGEKSIGSISEIQLNEWTSDAPYLKELERTAKEGRYQKYLSLKKIYTNQPSFFVDVARFFFETKSKELALQVLSNIAEMKLENPELLRIVANQLIEFGETGLATETFKEVLDIREEEPQSYRDLALAYNETGKYQEAVDLLYKVVIGTWDSRFGSVKAIAMNEMNAIISSHPKCVDVAAIEKRLIQPMPLDVRIVIGWSSNDSDMDLWVTDPAKEKCFYENTTTTGGGIISGDVTQGYGPEEFCVRKARNGNYLVDVNLFGDTRQTLGGPITIKAELFTNFGRPNQQRKVINCRVTTNKEVIRIGALHFGSKP
ncbi:MAG: VIT domain-containing protein [Chitinophagaceae bacterium]